MEDKTLDIQDLFYVLKNRYKVILIAVLICLLGAGFKVQEMKPSYTATVKIYASRNESMQANSTAELQSNASLIATVTQFIKTEDFMTKVVERSGLKVPPTALIGGLVFNTAQDVPIMNISYTAADIETAETVVETMSSEFETGITEIIPGIYTKVIDSVKVSTNMPNKKKIIIVALMAGIVLGIGIVLVLDYLDDRLRKKEEIEKLLGVSVVGIIPEYSTENQLKQKERKKRSIMQKVRCKFRKQREGQINV